MISPDKAILEFEAKEENYYNTHYKGPQAEYQASQPLVDHFSQGDFLNSPRPFKKTKIDFSSHHLVCPPHFSMILWLL